MRLEPAGGRRRRRWANSRLEPSRRPRTPAPVIASLPAGRAAPSGERVGADFFPGAFLSALQLARPAPGAAQRSSGAGAPGPDGGGGWGAEPRGRQAGLGGRGGHPGGGGGGGPVLPGKGDFQRCADCDCSLEQYT